MFFVVNYFRPIQPQSWRSRVRYWRVSERCSLVISSGREVGDGSADLENAVVGAGAQVEFAHRHTQQVLRLIAKLAVLLDFRACIRALQVNRMFPSNRFPEFALRR